MNVREMIEILQKINPEAEVLTEQHYDESLESFETLRHMTATKVTRKNCVNAGDVYWSNIPIGMADSNGVVCDFNGDDAETRQVVVLR